MCTHRLGGTDDGLLCDRETAHDPEARGGHCYTATVGPDLDNGSATTPKRHARSEDQ